MDNYYDDYKQVILDRFCDDSRCNTIADGDEKDINYCVQKASEEGVCLEVRYTDGTKRMFTCWKTIIDFISNCRLEDM